MAKRVIPPSDGLTMFINDNGSISLVQYDPSEQRDDLVVIELREVETVRQWLAELYAEATAGE